VVRANDFRKHFPIGVFVDAAGTCAIRDVNGSGTTVNANQAAGVKTMLTHPEVGLKPTGLNYIGWTNQQPYSQETLADISGVIEAQVRGGKVYQVAAPMDKATVDVLTGWASASWFGTAYDVGFHTAAAADALAENYAPIYADHPSVLAFNLRDDVSAAGKGTEAAIACIAMQRADPRPCTVVWRGKTSYALMGDDARLILSYHYPCGRDSGGVELPEGDFHRSTFSGFGGDWVDALRDEVSLLPAGAVAWFALQGHQTQTGTAATLLRYPTEREMVMQAFIAAGEGIKGFFYFAWTDQAGQWDGLGNPTSAARIRGAATVASRFTPAIRRDLLAAEKVADAFTASGGGSNSYAVNYANAYISTLQQGDGTYLVVVCNHDDATANVVISSASLTGKLVNLETGVETWLPATVSLGAFDGAIYRHDPAYGVPMTDPDLGVGVETWWATHWANADADEYQAPGDLPTHPRVVSVGAAADLQAAIDAAPDYTTFELAADGVYEGTIVITGRNGIHLVSADPLNPATLRRVEIHGSEQALSYDGAMLDGAYHNGFNIRLGTPADPNYAAALLAWEHPGRDYLIRDIAFVSDGDLCYYNWYGNNSGGWKYDHRAINMPVFLRNVRDVLIESCTFTGYEMGANPANPDTTGEVEVVPVVPGVNSHHDGFISGNSGITNVVCRDCTFSTVDAVTGYPWCFFLDGSRGAVFGYNTITGRYRQGLVLFLTNDDYSGDWDNSSDEGIGLRLDHQQRNARYNVVVGNTITTTSSSPLVSHVGFSGLILENTILNVGGTIAFVELVGRGSKSGLSTRGHRYHHLHNVIRGNTVPNGADIPQFVRFDGGSDAVAQPDPHNLLGQTIIADNVVAGTVTAWYGTEAGQWGSDGGDVATNNTDDGGTRDGV
jgi:hypothetical protein